MSKPKRHKGGQKNNHNALKHGIYAKVLSEAEKVELEEARAAQGLDDEIALIRLKICHLLEKQPDNAELLLKLSIGLSKLLRTRYELTPAQGKSVTQAIGNVVREIAIPLGIKVGEKLLNKLPL